MMIRHITIITLIKWSLLIILKSFAKLKRLYLANLILSRVVGGWVGQIKNIDHFSPAEAVAEVGNTSMVILTEITDSN